jgi:6-phosphogluconolactonase
VTRTLAIVSILAVGCGADPRADAGVHDAGRRVDGGGEDAGRDAGSPRVIRAYTGGSTGLLVAHTIRADGALTEVDRTTVGGNPSFAAVAPDGAHLYAVDENGGELVVLSIAPGTGATEVLARAVTGEGPTHVSLDPMGRFVMVASYTAGSVSIYPIVAGGSLGAATELPAGANAHQIVTDPSGRWVLVPCLGTDRIEVFALGAGGLTASTGVDSAGDGPRHLTFARDNRHVYVANELDSTVDVFTFDASSGALVHVQNASTLDGFGGSNTLAEIALHPSLDVLYVSNRGEDSIAIFDIAGDGRITRRGAALLEARRPRSFAITPDGALLLAGAADDDRVIAFQIASDGGLSRAGSTDVPSGVGFVGAFTIPR